MSVGRILEAIEQAAADNPVLLIAILLGVGSLLGSIKIKGIGLGPAAVLFLALAASAANPALALPAIVGNLGLALFAYTVGLSAGPSFFALLRRGSRMIVFTVGVLAAAGAVAALLSGLFGLSRGLAAGIYAGALTNTPALAAANEQVGSDEPVVGYSVTYLWGVLGMLIAATIAAKRRSSAAEKTSLVTRNVRVDRDGLPDLGVLAEQYGGRVVFSRVMHGDTPEHEGVVDLAKESVVPGRGDILTVVGSSADVEQVTEDLGHMSTVSPQLDRRYLDVCRVTVSAPAVSGVRLADLKLERHFGATATRVRRGDVDLLATEDLVLLPGDRVRVVGPRDTLGEVVKFFGDSESGAAAVNATGLGIGMTLGVLLGTLEWPLPAGTQFAFGIAGGCLVVGLILGAIMRTGPLVWALPTGVSATLSQLGLLFFLAFAGSVAGPALLRAFDSDALWKIFVSGFLLTSLVAASLFALARFAARLDGPMLAGVLAGAGTQPAVLAHANTLARSPDVNVGYALVYPAAMIAKVIVAPLVGTLLL